ncbi:MAG TPA: Crp/Fnr family transcriptional regulator [Pyrinomonadaceae bacterium]|nr:Crp/Fnr family transcriptional regulator [Pyrinomonadaceae bacterium]
MEIFAGQSLISHGNGSADVLSTLVKKRTPGSRTPENYSTPSSTENGLPRHGNMLLRAIDPEHFLRLRQFIKRVSLIKDQYVYQQDDRMGVIYFPESAVMSEFQILEDGRTIEVGLIGSEGAVGIPSAFNSVRAANCTQVCVPGTALAVGRDVFEREVISDPRLQLVLHSYLNAQIKQLSQRVVCNTFHSVEQRFCTWLLTLQNRSHRERFRLTHEHVARVLGVHRPSVTCIAQTLRDKKLIDYGRARLVICDPVGLEKLACRCSAELQTSEFLH